MAVPITILLVFCAALPTSKSLAVGVHDAGGFATEGEELIDAVQVDEKDTFKNIIPEMNQRLMTLEVAASRFEKNQLNMDLRLDRIEQIVHEKYGRPEEPADQIQNQSQPSAPHQQIESNPHDQDETGNEDGAGDTVSDASSLVTDATNDHSPEPNYSDQHEIVTAKINGVEKERPTQPVKDGQDVSGIGQQDTSYLHPAAQSHSPNQQSPSRPPSTPPPPPSTPPPPPQQTHPAKQQDQQHQLQTSQQQEQLQQLQQPVEKPQEREVGHGLDELDEIINLASGLTNNHHATIKRPVAIKRPAAPKLPAASRALAMRPISWDARRRTKISTDLEDFDLNLIDQGGLPWLP